MMSSSYDYFHVNLPDAPHSVGRIPRGHLPSEGPDTYEVIASCATDEHAGTVVRALNAFASMQRTAELVAVEPRLNLNREQVERLLDFENSRPRRS